jgi:hypothetical protein
MGVVASFYGISLGLVDFIIRERSPHLLKILLFLIVGMAILYLRVLSHMSPNPRGDNHK